MSNNLAIVQFLKLLFIIPFRSLFAFTNQGRVLPTYEPGQKVIPKNKVNSKVDFQMVGAFLQGVLGVFAEKKRLNRYLANLKRIASFNKYKNRQIPMNLLGSLRRNDLPTLPIGAAGQGLRIERFSRNLILHAIVQPATPSSRDPTQRGVYPSGFV